ncbi:hypothetical protein AcW2_001485 [Taiwanofungus camphoratus]|nr:hypothetical protein AcW2_001485 [Antrodia cinnamomea]
MARPIQWQLSADTEQILDPRFIPHSELIFRSAPINTTDTDYTSVNIMGASPEPRILLHISFRPSHNRLIFNTRSGGHWGVESKHPFEGIFVNSTRSSSFSVTDLNHEFHIHFDSGKKFVFPKRSSETGHAVAYHSHGGRTMFGSPLTVIMHPPYSGPLRSDR